MPVLAIFALLYIYHKSYLKKRYTIKAINTQLTEHLPSLHRISLIPQGSNGGYGGKLTLYLHSSGQYEIPETKWGYTIMYENKTKFMFIHAHLSLVELLF